ncbi:hypothetical protein B566_EDAN010786 [Ephemera danica]|nr:hypothetical protein B566_EDAN010786 [Ephemera danica]
MGLDNALLFGVAAQKTIRNQQAGEGVLLSCSLLSVERSLASLVWMTLVPAETPALLLLRQPNKLHVKLCALPIKLQYEQQKNVPPTFKTSTPTSRTQLKLQLMREQQQEQERRAEQARGAASSGAAATATPTDTASSQRPPPQTPVNIPHTLPPAVEVPPQVLQVRTVLENPTRYHVIQKQKSQVRQYLSESFQGGHAETPAARGSAARRGSAPTTRASPGASVLSPSDRGAAMSPGLSSVATSASEAEVSHISLTNTAAPTKVNIAKSRHTGMKWT